MGFVGMSKGFTKYTLFPEGPPYKVVFSGMSVLLSLGYVFVCICIYVYIDAYIQK